LTSDKVKVSNIFTSTNAVRFVIKSKKTRGSSRIRERGIKVMSKSKKKGKARGRAGYLVDRNVILVNDLTGIKTISQRPKWGWGKESRHQDQVDILKRT